MKPKSGLRLRQSFKRKQPRPSGCFLLWGAPASIPLLPRSDLSHGQTDKGAFPGSGFPVSSYRRAIDRARTVRLASTMNMASSNLRGSPSWKAGAAAPAEEASATPILRQYLRIALRWRYVILGVTAGCILLSLIITIYRHPSIIPTITITIHITIRPLNRLLRSTLSLKCRN